MRNYLKNTIVAKAVMAITGIVLVGFLFAHAIGNLQFMLGPNAYNSYAAMLQGNKLILWILRSILILCVIFHIISAIYLRFYNNAAKPEKYQVKNYLKAKATSRTMLWTGLLLLSGLTYHLLHFTTGDIDFTNSYDSYEVVPTGEFAIGLPKDGACCGQKENACCEQKEACCNSEQEKQHECCSDCNMSDDLKPIVKERHDVYRMVASEFSNPLVALSYILFVLLVGFHLNHAIQSAFHTLGAQGPKLTPCLRKLSVILSIILVFLFISLPISVMCGLVVGGCC